MNRIQSAADIVKEIAEEAVQVMRSANDLIRESMGNGIKRRSIRGAYVSYFRLSLYAFP